MDNEQAKQPDADNNEPPASKTAPEPPKKKFALGTKLKELLSDRLFLLTIALILLVGAGLIYQLGNYQEPTLPAVSKLPANIPTVQEPTDDTPPVDISTDLKPLTASDDPIIGSTLIPYYDARLKGDTKTAESFLMNYYTRNSSEDWKFSLGQYDKYEIMAAYTAPEAVNATYSTDGIPAGYDKQIMHRYLVNIYSPTQPAIQEYLLVYEFNDSTVTNEPLAQIVYTEFSSTVLPVVADADGNRYLVINSLKNTNGSSKYVAVGLSDPVGTACGAYAVSYSYCTFLTNDENISTGWSVVTDYTSKMAFGKGSYFTPNKNNPESVLFSSGFGDAGIGVASIDELNLKTGEIKEVISRSSWYNSYVDEQYWQTSNEPSEVISDCSKFAEGSFISEHITENNFKLDVYICSDLINDYSNVEGVTFDYYVYIDDEFVAEAQNLTAQNGHSGLEIDLEGNIYNGDKLTFSLLGRDFKVDLVARTFDSN